MALLLNKKKEREKEKMNMKKGSRNQIKNEALTSL